MSTIQDGVNTALSKLKGLTKIFNAQAEDKRVSKALKKMNIFGINQAIRDGILNPQTGQMQKLTDDQRNTAERERLKKSYHPPPAYT